jgi:hypothetical protein
MPVRLDRLSAAAGAQRRAYTCRVKRQRTRLVAWWALLAVFIAQLATAAYACPQIEAALSGPPAMDATTPCADMGMADEQDLSSLCLEHCKLGQQVVDTHSPVPQLDAAFVSPFFIRATCTDLASAVDLVPERVLARATAPPLFASSSRLRI